MPNYTNPLPRGKTAPVNTFDHLLGQEKWFPDVDYGATGVKTELSGMPVLCRYVRNTTGGVLLPGEIVTRDAASAVANDLLKHVVKNTGYIANTPTPIAGVVDEYVTTSGVADDEHFWMVVQGPTKFDGGEAGAAIGDYIVPHADDGKSGTFAHSGTLDAPDTLCQLIGRQLVILSATATTLTRGVCFTKNWGF